MTELQTGTTPLTDREWIVQATFATRHPVPEAVLIAIEELGREADRAIPREFTVATRAGAPGMVFNFDVDTPAAVDVAVRWAAYAAEEVAGYGTPASPTFELVDLRIVTPEVFEADALRPDTPELLAATDVADELGISRQRVHQLATENPLFPAPYARLGSGPIWTRPAIEAFDRAWTRKPGRPARKAS